MFHHLEKEFFNQGYYLVGKNVYNKQNKRMLLYSDKSGYLQVSFKTGSRKNNSRKTVHVSLHRLIALKKYGNQIYIEGIEARHKDNNKLNNHLDNILIGTHSENMMDIPPDIRLKKSMHAATSHRKFSDVEIIEIKKYHLQYRSYKRTMHKFNISSKGTLHYILKHNYKTTY